MSETHLSELGAQKRGPKASSTALKFRMVGLTAHFWEYVALFATDEERAQIAADQAAGKTGNYTPALNRLVDVAMKLKKNGPNGTPKRDARGRWTAEEPGTSKTAKTRQRKREQKEQVNNAN